MGVKCCSKCNIIKSLNEFREHPLGKFKKQSICRECGKINWREWRTKNKPLQAVRAAKQRQINQKKFLEYKATLKCNRGGFNHPAALVFHHKNPKQKDFTVSTKRFGSLPILKKEIAKCEVLCSNCHLIHHHEEKHNTGVII